MMTTERLAELAAMVLRREEILTRCGPSSATVADKPLAAAVPELLDALRWRKAGEELPDEGVDVSVIRSFGTSFIAEVSSPESRAFGEGERYWIYDGDSDEVDDDDLWLPLPPRPKREK